MENFLDHIDQAIPLYAVPVVNSGLAVLGAIILYALIVRALRKIAKRGFLDPDIRVLLERITKWLLAIITILLSLGFFGVSVGTLWAALSGVLALIAVGFVAVWSVLSNVLCSVLLIIFPPFRIGDDIEIQEPTANFAIKGKVVSTNMIYTSLEVAADTDSVESILRIPNNIFFQKYIRVIPGKKTESLKKYVARQQDDN